MALEIVIPDSGPLMSLGRINRLDLLDRFACPILITDMVADEVLRGMPGAPDALVFKDWFEHRGNQIQTVETSIGILWKAVPRQLLPLERGSLYRKEESSRLTRVSGV